MSLSTMSINRKNAQYDGGRFQNERCAARNVYPWLPWNRTPGPSADYLQTLQLANAPPLLQYTPAMTFYGDKFGREHRSGAKDVNKNKSRGYFNDKKRQAKKKQMVADKKALCVASYVGVPSADLYCHVCSEHMEDAKSFTKHIHGKQHKLIMTCRDEEYKKCVDVMRLQIRTDELQRGIDLDCTSKLKSNNNNNLENPITSNSLLRNYCNMCDVIVYGNFSKHRNGERHKKLKQFLHPKCKLCGIHTFPTRLHMDEHKLTAGHLMKVADMRTVNHTCSKDDETDETDLTEATENKSQDQIPTVKKDEMLEDLNPNKLKLELEDVCMKIKEKNNNLATKTAISIDKKVNENNVKNNESKMETSNTDKVKDSTAIQTNINEASDKKIDKQAYGPKCALVAEEPASTHCQTAAYDINNTEMNKMKKSSKKRIDKVITDTKEPIVKRPKFDEKSQDVVDMESDGNASQMISVKIETML